MLKPLRMPLLAPVTTSTGPGGARNGHWPVLEEAKAQRPSVGTQAQRPAAGDGPSSHVSSSGHKGPHMCFQRTCSGPAVVMA